MPNPSDTPTYYEVVEHFQKQRDLDVRAIRDREPWSLKVAKQRVARKVRKQQS